MVSEGENFAVFIDTIVVVVRAGTHHAVDIAHVPYLVPKPKVTDEFVTPAKRNASRGIVIWETRLPSSPSGTLRLR